MGARQLGISRRIGIRLGRPRSCCRTLCHLSRSRQERAPIMTDVTPAPAVKTVPKPRDQHLRNMADCIRFLSMDAVQQAKSGHPGAPMGMADTATVLFRDFMQFDAADPHWFDRDRFVLSNGHASMLLYSLLYLTGVKDMTLDELKRFRQIDSKTAGHPEYKHADGIETTTGPLGQGVANSVGFALAERIMNAKFGDDLCKHWTYGVMSGLPPFATELRKSLVVRFVPMPEVGDIIRSPRQRAKSDRLAR